VGYHFLIGKNGSIYEGRALEVRGTHVEAYNTGSLGVCFLGNFQVDTVNDAQFDAAQRLLRWLVARLHITHIAGHRDFNPQTECPGSNLDRYVTALATAFNLIKSADGYRPPLDATETSRLPACLCCGHCQPLIG
jgi:N-acetyl-anhydromuramyl-L-alanine amidase AmpD